jgi:hypothetical protein
MKGFDMTIRREPLLRSRPGFLTALLLFTVGVRLLPYTLAHFGLKIDPAATVYPWNFSALPAICLFGGACFAERRWSFAIPLAALLVGDFGIWALTGRADWAFYPSQPVVYASYALIVVLGFALRHRRPAWAVGAMGLAGSVMFYLTTNFGVWLFGDGALYPHTPAGLLECYVAALPFFRNWLIGMAVFLPILFSPLAMAERGPAAWEAEPAYAPVRRS